MSIRNTEEYKLLDRDSAILLAEGVKRSKSDLETTAAWQYIYDQNLHVTLDRFFGKTISRLLETGELEG